MYSNSATKTKEIKIIIKTKSKTLASKENIIDKNPEKGVKKRELSGLFRRKQFSKVSATELTASKGYLQKKLSHRIKVKNSQKFAQS